MEAINNLYLYDWILKSNKDKFYLIYAICKIAPNIQAE